MKKTLMSLIVLLFVGVHLAVAQSRMVKGKVLDEKGLGYPGAGVSVKGAQIGTVTDIDGNFQIDVPNANNVLIVQAVSYATQEVNITAGGNVTVRLAPASRELQGTVVTALAVRREKRELGYSATTISNQDLTAGNNVSALSALQGKVAGANITSTTGGPGGSTRVVLRGEKSLTGDNNAIMVVDGVIISNRDRTGAAYDKNNLTDDLNQVDFGNSGNDINPDDIESVTVLSGPAAAALYGSIGSNGAIMITTKSGKNRTGNKKTEVTFKSTFTLSDILKYPDVQHTYGQGNIYDGLSNDPRENFSWGLPFDGQLRPWGQAINGKQLIKPYSDQPNNIKSFFNIGKTSDNYASIAGGNENSTYFLSLNAVNNTGVIPNTFYDKYSIRFNGSTQLTNKLFSSVSINYINTYSRVEAGGQASGSVYDNILQTARDIPIWELKNYNNPYYSMEYTDPNGIKRYGYYGAYTKNPYWVADNYDNRNKTDRILGNLTIGYRSFDNIEVIDRLGVDVSADRSYYKAPKFNSIPFDPSGLWDNYPQISQGGYKEADLNALSLNNDLIATYKKDLSENLSMDILGGYNMRLSNTTALVANIDPGTNGLIVPGFYNFDNAQGPIQVTNTLTQTRSMGVYGSANIKYKNRLFAGITARNDWTSTLIEGNRSYFYPSVSGSYVFTEGVKGKFKDKVLNYGKIRASYASVGTGAPAYANNNAAYTKAQVDGGFGPTVLFPFNGQPGYGIDNTIGAPLLRPERTNSYEIGTDLSFLNDLIAFSFTYYYNLTVDQIAAIPTPVSTGYNFRYVNLGSVENKGVEMTARITPIRTKSGFKWDLFGTYTQNMSKVLSLSEGVSRITLGGFSGMSIAAAVGRPYGAFYAVDLLHDDQGHVVVNGNTGQKSSGIPLTTDQPVYKGTFQPKFIASWGTTLSFKGFTLNALFVTKQGGLYYSRTRSDMDFNGTAAETADRDPKIFPNSVYKNSAGQYVTNTSVKYSPYYYYTTTLQNLYTPNLVDASYIKLQEVSITYSIPASLLRRTPFGGLTVGLFGNNLFIWTASSNKFDDPEENSSGVTGAAGNAQGFNYTARPSIRNFGASIKVNF